MSQVPVPELPSLLAEENAMGRILSRAHYVKVFSQIAEEIIEIEKTIKNAEERRNLFLKGPTSFLIYLLMLKESGQKTVTWKLLKIILWGLRTTRDS
jgi:hypothetical protein